MLNLGSQLEIFFQEAALAVSFDRSHFGDRRGNHAAVCLKRLQINHVEMWFIQRVEDFQNPNLDV